MAKVTPARRQYLDIKKQYPDCILFFRMGDFYEMFDDDAVVASRELEITLTSRKFSKRNGTETPMAGVPHHAVDGYIYQLIEKGYHVAVCDQMSEPTGRGIVDREVVRVMTPGTLTEPQLLDKAKPNYLMCVVPVGNPESGKWHKAGLAFVDISTGQFEATQLEGDNVGILVLEELARLTPREVIMPESWVERGVSMPDGIHLSPVQDWTAEFAGAEQLLKDHFQVGTLDGYGLVNMPHAISAAGAALQYLRVTQKNSLSQLVNIRTYSTSQFMVLDQFTRRNLELTQTIRSGKTRGSVLGVLDRTVTAMGARLLRTWMLQPLLDLKRLNARLDAVDALTHDEALRLELRALFKHVSDIERLVNRLLIGKANPRDLLGLRDSLSVIPNLGELINDIPALQALTERLDPCADVYDLITQAITDDPPATLNNTGIIRQGFSKELDEILASTQDARDWIANLEPTERRRTGIPTIKVSYNKVFGYYIEVTKAQSDKVPDDYIRKQTLVNAERYITPQLKEYEALVLSAEEEILKTEREIYEQVCRQLCEFGSQLLRTARAIAHLDTFLALATVAVNEGYVRPTLTEDNVLHIKDGRHPVVEKLLDDVTRYVPNDTTMTAESRVHIITGPNMSGKSTYIRQVAIIAMMAQIGSFVPADEAIIGLVDRIFARIGAQDEIHAGQSTFMVEMIETARLLSGSSHRSLLILDEIGRGTSTYDGLAIARAVIEYIHNNPRLNCRTLFATHYHELTELPNILPRTENHNVAVAERGEDIVFLHKVVLGGADQSYGVHVAQLAGMPRPVVERARALLAQLEESGSDFKLQKPKSDNKEDDKPAQLSFFAPKEENPAIEAIRQIEVDSLSPLEALTKLYELKKLAESD
ncbi:MAG: DNA mismatch repair protein MutS [Anaerolineae bacterium]|nr:DNA mismatch repair protein MutS [Anaerolineae bacterium]